MCFVKDTDCIIINVIWIFLHSAKSCVYHGDKKAIYSLISGDFLAEEMYVDNWKYPAGAFHGAVGDPCWLPFLAKAMALSYYGRAWK